MTGGPGWFEDLGPFATPIATLAGQKDRPVLAVIERDAIGPGSGRVVLASDQNWIFDQDAGDFYFPEHEVLFCNVMAWLTEERPPVLPSFRRGDTDASGIVDISDPIFNLTFQFVGGIGDLPCEDAADVDDSGVVDISDPIYNLTFQFVGGVDPPPPPGPRECGTDPTAEDPDEGELTCEASGRRSLRCGDGVPRKRVPKVMMRSRAWRHTSGSSSNGSAPPQRRSEIVPLSESNGKTL